MLIIQSVCRQVIRIVQLFIETLLFGTGVLLSAHEKIIFAHYGERIFSKSPPLRLPPRRDDDDDKFCATGGSRIRFSYESRKIYTDPVFSFCMVCRASLFKLLLSPLFPA